MAKQKVKQIEVDDQDYFKSVKVKESLLVRMQKIKKEQGIAIAKQIELAHDAYYK